MITVSRTVRTTATIDAVWAYLSDFTNAEQWDPGTVTCTRKDAGPVGVGATYENVSEFRGKKTTLEYRITTFEAPHHLVLEGQNKSVRFEDDLTMRSIDGGTELIYTAHFTFKGLARLAEPLLKKALNKLADDTEESLETNLDAR